MKYKKKTTEKNKSAEEARCVDPASYSILNQAAALAEAQSQATAYYNDPLNIGEPFVLPSNGCSWRVRVEVKDAYYTLIDFAPIGWGLPPLPRCQQKPTKPTGTSLGQCQNGTPIEVNEYTPGGTKPPCPNNVEGPCANSSTERNWSEGSSWQIDNSGRTEYKTALNYTFRLHPTSIYKKWGSGNCRRPDSTPWFRKRGQGNTQSGRVKAKVTKESRCYDVTSNYDCCCTCPPVKVPYPIYCPRPIQLNQAQVNQLRNGIMIAFAAGLCALVVSRGTALRALMLGAIGAAGCDSGEEEIEGGCQNTGQ